MKLTAKTLAVLKNFYAINQSIRFTPGDVLRTMAASKSIIAQAKVDVNFATQFCIYDLSRFLAVYSLFEDPDVEATEKSVELSDKTSSVTYVCCVEKNVTLPPSKNIDLPSDVTCKFNLANAELQKLFKAMAIMGLSEVAFIGDGEHLTVTGIDADGKIQDRYNLKIGETSKTYKAIFKIDNLNKIMPSDYEITIAKLSDKQGGTVNLSHFKSLTEDVEYWIVLTSESQL
jgi:hypothetical protein